MLLEKKLTFLFFFCLVWQILFAMLDRKYGTVTDISDELAWATYQRVQREQRLQRNAAVVSASKAVKVGESVSAPKAKGGGTTTVSTKGLSKREKRRLRKKIAEEKGAQKATVIRPPEAEITLDDDRAVDTNTDELQCKTCLIEFGSRNELFRHLRKTCKPSQAVYFPGQTLNPDAAKVVTRKKKKKKK